MRRLPTGAVQPGGIVSLAALALLCDRAGHPSVSRHLRVVSGLAVAGMVAALFLHAVPFFNNPTVFDAFAFGGCFSPIRMFDKSPGLSIADRGDG